MTALTKDQLDRIATEAAANGDDTLYEVATTAIGLMDAHKVDNGFDITDGLHEARQQVLDEREKGRAARALRVVLEKALEDAGLFDDVLDLLSGWGGASRMTATDRAETAYKMVNEFVVTVRALLAAGPDANGAMSGEQRTTRNGEGAP